MDEQEIVAISEQPYCSFLAVLLNGVYIWMCVWVVSCLTSKNLYILGADQAVATSFWNCC